MSARIWKKRRGKALARKIRTLCAATARLMVDDAWQKIEALAFARYWSAEPPPQPQRPEGDSE